MANGGFKQGSYGPTWDDSIGKEIERRDKMRVAKTKNKRIKKILSAPPPGKPIQPKYYILTIQPAIVPEERHKIEEVLKKMGYHVTGGGTDTDMSACDISFLKDLKEAKK